MRFQAILITLIIAEPLADLLLPTTLKTRCRKQARLRARAVTLLPQSIMVPMPHVDKWGAGVPLQVMARALQGPEVMQQPLYSIVAVVKALSIGVLPRNTRDRIKPHIPSTALGALVGVIMIIGFHTMSALILMGEKKTPIHKMSARGLAKSIDQSTPLIIEAEETLRKVFLVTKTLDGVQTPQGTPTRIDTAPTTTVPIHVTHDLDLDLDLATAPVTTIPIQATHVPDLMTAPITTVPTRAMRAPNLVTTPQRKGLDAARSHLLSQRLNPGLSTMTMTAAVMSSSPDLASTRPPREHPATGIARMMSKVVNTLVRALDAAGGHPLGNLPFVVVVAAGWTPMTMKELQSLRARATQGLQIPEP